MTISLYEIGSDPEFLFATGSDWIFKFRSAQEFLKTSREAGMRTWIGNDGHPSTAEIRPLPSRSVWLHLLHIATALTRVAEAIALTPNNRLIAQPYCDGESLGGHIHTSLWVHDGLSEHILQKGAIGFGGRLIPLRNSEPPSERYSHTYLESPTTFTLDRYITKMDWLLEPFDQCVQNQVLRAARRFTDAARPSTGALPSTAEISRHRSAGYVHLEYRKPSTWLAHPLLAFCYLGLAKLTILRWESIPVDNAPVAAGEQHATFWERYRIITDFKLPWDLRNLKSCVKKTLDSYERWARPPVLVDLPAWKELLK